MNSYDVVQMIEPKEDRATLKALYGTIKTVHTNGTADVLIDGSTSLQRLINWSGGQVGARCMVAMRGTDWVVISASTTSEISGVSLMLENQPANEIPNGANLNSYTTPGTYQCSASANTSNITNMPIAGSAFKLIVEKPLSGGYKTQFFRQFGKESIYIRNCDNLNTTWHAWQRLAPLTDIYPVGAIYIAYTATSPATLFGGTWAVLAAGRVLIGRGSNGTTNYATAGATGGSEIQYLQAAIGATHGDWYRIGYKALSPIPGITYTFSVSSVSGTVALDVPATSINHTVGVYQSDGKLPTTVQPYQVVYMWRRTA